MILLMWMVILNSLLIWGCNKTFGGTIVSVTTYVYNCDFRGCLLLLLVSLLSPCFSKAHQLFLVMCQSNDDIPWWETASCVSSHDLCLWCVHHLSNHSASYVAAVRELQTKHGKTIKNGTILCNLNILKVSTSYKK